MSSAASSSLPTSLSTHTPDRFSPISPDDHAGYLWIATLLAAIYSLLSILVRAYVKRDCLGADDWICAAATILGTGAFLAIFVGLVQGLGKSSDSVDAMHLQDIGKSIFVSRIISVTASCLAKSSVIFLIRRLFSEDMIKKRTICDVVFAITILWGLGSLVGVSAHCDPRELLQPDGLCSDQLTRWEFIGILDAISELLIFLLSFGLIWGLQMRLDLKVRVVLAFIFRLPLIGVAIVHILFLRRSMNSTNLNLVLIPPLVCEQIELGYSLLSATIPNLKSFIMSFDTAMMMDISHKLQSQPNSHTDISNRLGSSSDRAPRLSDIECRDTFISRLRPETELRHIASVQHLQDWTDDGSFRNFERESQDRMIRCDIRWTIEEARV